MEPQYYDEYSRIEREHWWFQARKEILGRLLDRTFGGRSLRILDLGCGTGESVRHLSRWGHVVGLDFSSQALAYCRGNGLKELVQGDAVHLPFADGSFDLVCGLDILEHLDADHTALAEIKRVCRPDGHVLLMVPALPILWGEHDELNHHLRRYRKVELRRAVAGAGLECDLLTYYNTFLFPLVLCARLVRRVLRRFNPTRTPVSDFSYSGGGLLCSLLRRVFSMEAGLIGRVPLPIGASLLCIARKTRGASPVRSPLPAPVFTAVAGCTHHR